MKFAFCRTVIAVLLTLLLPTASFLSDFLVGCIGPREAFERYLTVDDRALLSAIIADSFDGSNRNEVLDEIDEFLKARLTVRQWIVIRPEIDLYQRKHVDCSPYAHILPPKFYKPLAQAVRRAEANGASRPTIKFLVDDYIDRILASREFERELNARMQREDPRFPIVDQRKVARHPIQRILYPRVTIK